MKKVALPAAALVLLYSAGCDEYTPKAQVEALQAEIVQLRTELALATAKAEQSNRWRIEMRTGVRTDTYLIDTSSGRVWREYEGPDHKMSWQETPRIDRPHSINDGKRYANQAAWDKLINGDTPSRQKYTPAELNEQGIYLEEPSTTPPVQSNTPSPATITKVIPKGPFAGKIGISHDGGKTFEVQITKKPQ